MTSCCVFRTDLFPGSGYGHVKRCMVLARALAEHKIDSHFVLDPRAEALGDRFALPDHVLFAPSHASERADALFTIEKALELKAQAIILDSYILGEAFRALVVEAGIKLIVIDDHETSGSADLTINYKPGISIDDYNELPGPLLAGERFFLTDATKLQRPSEPQQKPLNVIIHAGGNGQFDALGPVPDQLIAAAEQFGWQVSWLCPHSLSKSWVEQRTATSSANHKILDWQKNARDLWASYDLMVGPASTSVYEAILQSCLPISFAASPTQTDARTPWVHVGHLLHLEHAEAHDPDVLKQIFTLVDAKFEALSAILRDASSGLDGKGADRVATAIRQLLHGEPISEHASTTDNAVNIRACVPTDAHGFLQARNAPGVRAVSTQPDHVISWPEHLSWWLLGTTERFIVEQNGKPLAYFWHRAKRIDGKDFLIGGWFPAVGHPNFIIVMKMIDWQLKQGDATHPDHVWIATINKENKAVIALNRRFGYVDASQTTQSAAKQLFPGTSDAFEILERAVP